MRRAEIIIGRFAFGGWAIITGTIIVVSIVSGVIHKYSRLQSDTLTSFLLLFLYGIVGLIGGAVVGVVAAVLDRLIKRPAGKAANEAASNDPAVWPPAPKSPH